MTRNDVSPRQFRIAALFAFVALIAVSVGCTQQVSTTPIKAPPPRTVVTVAVESQAVERITTQPATVHAMHEARLFAKTSGYVADLKVDIGSKVKKGDLLAIFDVPEIVAEVQQQEAQILQINAAVEQAAAQVAVAKAEVLAAESSRDQAAAGEQQSAAQLKADEAEHKRVAELVKQKAVADRLLDEATNRLDATKATQVAAKAQTAAATAMVEVAKARHAAAEADLAAAKAEVNVGQKRLEELQTMMGYAQLQSPFDGTVVERNVELGDLVGNSQNSSATKPLFIVAKLDTVRIRVAVPERDAPLANIGDSATVTLQALPGLSITGEVSRTSGALAESTRTMLVEIDLPNPEGKLIPGMFGQATILLESQSDQITLPAGTVRFDESGRSYVYIVDDQQTIQVVDVTTGFDDGHQIEITSGLDRGERVVGPMLHRLSTGQKVNVEG